VAASSLLTASDPDGDAIASYAFKDTGSGHFYLNGVAQPNNQEIDVTAAQLSQLTYQSGGGADSVQVRVNDGTLWSSWQSFTVTAPAATVIESAGSTSLVQVGNNYYLYANGTSSGPSVKVGGAVVTMGSQGTWNPIGAEQTATGYEVAWKDSGSNQYVVWATDSSGNLVSFMSGVVAGTSATLESLEASFHQDLNGDSVISGPITIEAFGSTKFDQAGSYYYLDSVGGGAGPLLKAGGTAVAAGANGTWNPIGVEQTATGYEVAWKDSGSNQYIVWATDSSGNLVSFMTGVVAGTSATLESLEASFHQDLNGDGVITAPTTIESFGATKLDQVGANYYFDAVSGGTGPMLKIAGAAVAAGANGTWNPIGVEQTATGYEVAWKDSAADQYIIWATDGSGNLTSFVTGVVSGASDTLKSFEASFQQDLNGDSVITTSTAIESSGSTKLDLSGTNYSLDPIGGGSGPTLKVGGTAVAMGSQGAWTPIGAEQTATGYEVAWKNGSADQYIVWATDSSGNLTSLTTGVLSGASATLKNFETSFQQDLNGDGVISPVVNAATLSNATDLLQFAGNSAQANFNFASSDAPKAEIAGDLLGFGAAHAGAEVVAGLNALFTLVHDTAQTTDAQNVPAADMHVHIIQGFHLL
jgi:serralysin